MKNVATFSLDAKIYSHSASPVPVHTLVACIFPILHLLISGGAELPSIRLVDLRSGDVAQTLAGHSFGFVVAVRWSPTHPHLLASGGMDGTVRLWDVRRGKSCLASLDQHNTASRATGGWLNTTNKAHRGTVNGLEFTSDGLHLASLGHDEQMRVWDLETGLNTLVSFGPTIRNQARMEVKPYITPPDTCFETFVYVPSDDSELLCFELFTGKLVSRLQVLGGSAGRVTCVAGRRGHQELYTGAIDTEIGIWESNLVYRPAEDSKVAENILRGQQLLRDLSKAFIPG